MSASLSSSSSQTYNSTNNTSTVTVGATVTINYGYFQGYQSWGRVNINGTTYSIAGPTYMAALSDPHVAPESWYFEQSVTFDHPANGYRGAIACSASFDIDGYSAHNCSSDTGDQGAIDITRVPYAPPAPTLSRDGSSITMSTAGTVQAAGTGGAKPVYAAPAIDYYHWYWGTDSSTPNYLAQATSPYTYPSFTKTQPIYISAYSHNSEGFGPEGGATYIAGAPSTPGQPSITRNTNNGSTITVGWSAPANNGAGISSYRVYLRENSGGWSGPYTTTGTSYTFNSLTNTSTYGAIVGAYNSSGWSDNSTESTIVGVPTQPSSITVPTPVGLATTVSWGTSTNGTISNYYISASSDNGVTWQTEIAKGTATSHPFTGLDGGKTYKFRVRAQNEIGYSTYVTSASIFVAAGGRRFRGTGEVNAGTWQPTATAKRFDGSLWQPLSIAKKYSLSSKDYTSSSSFSTRPGIQLKLDTVVTPTSITTSNVSYVLSLVSINTTTAYNTNQIPWSISITGATGSASGSTAFNVTANSTLVIASGNFSVINQTANSGLISVSFTDNATVGTATTASSVVWSPWIVLS